MVQKVLPNATTFIDIGANKLYTTAAIYALWSPQLKFTPQTLHRALVAEREGDGSTSTSGSAGDGDNLCGVCNDCREELSPFGMWSAVYSPSPSPFPSPSPQEEQQQQQQQQQRDGAKSIRVLSFDGQAKLVEQVSIPHIYTVTVRYRALKETENETQNRNE
jgi:hypothetical protein